VHLADFGYPLVGDKLYGRKRTSGRATFVPDAVIDGFPRQALHAKKLALDAAQKGRRMEFVAPLPKDLRSLLEYVETQAQRAAAKKIDGRKGVDKKGTLK
jgi:23S rRNA pseudouridine1911/1915/1917 synthase